MLFGLLGLSRWHPANGWWLPDAAFAVFFLVGRFFPMHQGLPFVGGGVALFIDVGISQMGGIENYCLTPAYGVLLLSYAWMWQTGRWSLSRDGDTWRGVFTLLASCAGATSLAFVLNHSGFYVWSGHFAELAWLDYLAATGHYFWSYLGATVMYVAVGLGIAAVMRENEGHRALSEAGANSFAHQKMIE